MQILDILASAASKALPSPTSSATVATTPKPAATSDFLDACLTRIESLDLVAWVMLWAALLLAFIAGLVTIYRLAYPPKGDGPAGIVAPPSLAEAAVKLLETLGKLPVWFALFVGGFALAWLASGLSDGQCGNRPDTLQTSGSVTKASGEKQKTAERDNEGKDAPPG